MSKLDLRVLRLLFKAKGQNIAVALVVGIGLMFYIAMSSAIVNLDTTVKSYYDLSNAADLYIELPRATESDILSVSNMSGVQSAQGRIVKDARFVGEEDEKVTLRLISLPDGERPINDLYHHDSNLQLSQMDEAFLYQSFSKARNLGKNSKVEVQAQGQSFKFNVKGIVSSSEYVYLMENDQSLLPDFKNFGLLYVSESFAMRSLNTGGTYNQILVKIKPGYNQERVLKSIEKRLESKGISRIYLRKDQLSSRMVQEEINGNKKTSTAVPIFFLAIAAAIMYVMVSRMVKNDKMTIGVLKALGFSSGQIIRHYSLYALGIGFFGALIGILFGTMLSYYITLLYATESFNIPILKTTFQPWMFINPVLLSGGFSLLAGIMGAYSAVNIDPAVAMRPEEPRSGRRIWLEGTKLWNHISFTEKMVIRNVLRNKLRMLVLAVGIALTYVVILMPVFFVEAFVDMFEFQYGQMQKMDYSVTFNQFTDGSVKKNLLEYDGVKSVEEKIEFPYEVVSGHYKKSINVIGLIPDTKMYRFYDSTTNKPLNEPLSGLKMSEGLAKAMHLKVGDSVKLKPYLPGAESKIYKIDQLVLQNLGANIYLPIGQMQKDYFGEGAVNGVYVKADAQFKQVLNKGKNVSSLLSTEDMKNAYKEFMDLTNASIGMMMFFGMILGVAIVYNTVVMMMNERSVEIASMRVLGVKNSEVFSIFIREILLMSFLGILLGIPLGKYSLASMSNLFTTDLYAFKAEVSLDQYLLALVITLVTIGLSLGLSYEKIRKADFIDALKSRVS